MDLEQVLSSTIKRITKFRNTLYLVYISYLFLDGDDKGHWELTKDNIVIKQKGKIFSPGNTRRIQYHAAYREVVDYWIHNGYTLRYSGGMAPDIC